MKNCFVLLRNKNKNKNTLFLAYHTALGGVLFFRVNTSTNHIQVNKYIKIAMKFKYRG